MSNYIKIGLQLLWLAVIGYWFISGFSAKKTSSQESFYKQFIQYWLPLLISALLLGPGEWFGDSLLRENFVPHTNLVGTIGLAICFVGASIACWSRFLLGKNWSVSVQKKENHELVQHGIYSVLRHPIYTGLVLLFAGNALIVGDYRGIIAVIIVFVSFLLKLKKEEKILTEIFGSQYADYKDKTKALIPFVL